MDDVIEVTKDDESRALSLFLAMVRYLPTDGERRRWVFDLMTRNFAKARVEYQQSLVSDGSSK